jgi:hypothetical protein
MSSWLPEVLDVEYRRMRKIARLVLVAMMAIPVYFYGPQLWRDGSYGGRWIFAGEVDVRPVECSGAIFFLQFCDVKFTDRSNNRAVTLDYAVVGTDWNQMVPDIVRTSAGHYSSAIAVTGPGLFARGFAFGVLAAFAFLVEWLLMRIAFKALLRKATAMEPASRVREAVLLSRDRRDRI